MGEGCVKVDFLFYLFLLFFAKWIKWKGKACQNESNCSVESRVLCLELLRLNCVVKEAKKKWRMKGEEKSAGKDTDTQIQSRVHTHRPTFTYEAVHSAWKRHRLMRENTHRPLNQNRAKVKHILGLSLACVWKCNKATATSECLYDCISLRVTNVGQTWLGWLWFVLRPTWRMCNLYKCQRLCVWPKVYCVRATEKWKTLQGMRKHSTHTHT